MRRMDDWWVSVETGESFSHCLCCQLPLLEIAAPWLVNQEFHHGECVREYAICQPCRDSVTERFSEESKRAVRSFLEREIDWDARMSEFMGFREVEERFDSCISCRTPRREIESYGISALFDEGGELVMGVLPLLMCCDCSGRMMTLLSAASREVWRKFLADHFSGPPDLSGFLGLL